MHRPYCLRCYAELVSIERPGSACASCGFLNLEVDRRLFWTKERRLREFEDLAKAVIVFLLVGLSLLILFGFEGRVQFGTGQGWVVGLPILFGAILWETASKITRWKPYFRPTIVWSLIAVIGGSGVLAVMAFERTSARERNVMIAVAAICFLLAFSIVRFGQWCEGWRERRIRSGSSRLAHS